MKYLPLICLVLLTACKSTVPSENMADSVISDLKAHQNAISILDKQTTKECRTDAFVASLNALKAQTESMEGQVKSISQACKIEKKVLEQEIVIRNIIITVLCAILAIILILWVKFRK